MSAANVRTNVFFRLRSAHKLSLFFPWELGNGNIPKRSSDQYWYTSNHESWHQHLRWQQQTRWTSHLCEGGDWRMRCICGKIHAYFQVFLKHQITLDISSEIWSSFNQVIKFKLNKLWVTGFVILLLLDFSCNGIKLLFLGWKTEERRSNCIDKWRVDERCFLRASKINAHETETKVRQLFLQWGLMSCMATDTI